MSGFAIGDVLMDETALGVVGTTYSKSKDFGIADPNMGAGTPLYVNARLTSAGTSMGAATLQINLQDSADDSSFATIDAGTVHAKAALINGFYAVQTLLPNKHRRYVRFETVVADTDFDTGEVFGTISQNRPTDVNTNPAGVI